jgi:hypothetical protein
VISNFNDRVKEIHASLDAHAIPHAFGGAIALIYGVHDPRLTHDIDINISVPVDDVQRVFDSLPPSLPWTPKDAEAVMVDGQVRLYWEPDLPVDLFFPQHEFHQTVAGRARVVTFDGEPLPVVTPTDLTVFKALFNRSKDWPDIEAMLRAGTVDQGEALRWVGEILGQDHESYLRLTELIDEVRARPIEGSESGDPNVWKRVRSGGRAVKA